MSRVAFIALAFAGLLSSTASAQHSVLAEFYGRGVHSYYSGDLITAYDFLTKAIDGGIKDPRAYYFRGLTSVASGRQYEAEADYKAGADIEARGIFGPSVGQSLARIQGTQRLAIENVRQIARLEYQSTAAARSKARYEDLEASSGAPRPSAVPPRAPAPPVPPAAAAMPADDNPFPDEPAGEPKVEVADALEGADATDPFADDASPAAAPGAAAAEEPAGDDPFGAPADEPAAGGDDPFGADPFGN